MRLRTFALLLGVPLLLMGALIVGLQIGQDELEQSVRSDPQTSSTATGGRGDAAAAQRGVSLKRIGRFSSPVLVTAPRGDTRRVFVVEQGGTIRVLVGGKRVRRPFLDIRRDVTAGGEQGLLGLAFAPDYGRSGLFYVYFTARNAFGDRRGDVRVVDRLIPLHAEIDD